MKAILKGNKIIFKDVEYTLNSELYNKYTLQTNEIYLKSDLSWSASLNEALSFLKTARDKELSKTDYVFYASNSSLTTIEKTEIKAKIKALMEIANNVTTVEQALIKIKSIV